MQVNHRTKLFLFVLIVASCGFAGTSFKATTTLTAETANNTSAADSFVTQTNGNMGANNVSKVPLRTLLYAGSTAKVYAHLVVWFGFGSNMDVGYTSSDPIQVHNQVTDMISRGLDGTIINWYGQGKYNPSLINYDQATQVFMHEAELHPNFSFAIMPDGGALRTCSQTAGCDVTQTLINDLTYAYNTFETSPAYMHYNNQPVVYFFGEEFYPIDWNLVRASVPGNPLFIFRNTEGFNYTQSNGAFAWVEPTTATASDPMGLNYMGQFDSLSQSLLPIYSNVAGYKGFNDSLAAWGEGRVVQQQCGQTWLQSVAESGKYYSAASQMLGIQLVTWNDYEEGTEFESGIDNCVTVSGSAGGTVVSWSITGQTNTLDHYTVFASQDGENLMWLADVPVSTNSLDLAQFGFAPGTYTVYVKAVGKPSLTNKMSGGIAIVIADQPPVAVLNVSPNSGKAPFTVTASTAGSSDPDGTIMSTMINFGDGSGSVNAASAIHTYSTSGSFTVTATVTDNLGSAATATATVNVTNQPPVAVLNVTPTSGNGPLTVSASTAGTADPDGMIVSTTINFGDGSAGVNAASATHVYNSAGTYTVTATVIDNFGAVATASKAVTVVDSTPAPTFSLDPGGNTTITVAAGQTAIYNLALNTKGSGFTGTVALSCSGAPVGVTCSINPSSASFTAGTVSVPITVTAATTLNAHLAPARLWTLPFTFAVVVGGLFFAKRRRQMVLTALAVLLVAGVIGCGGGGNSSASSNPVTGSPTTATLTVTGTGGGVSATAKLTLIITH